MLPCRCFAPDVRELQDMREDAPARDRKPVSRCGRMRGGGGLGLSIVAGLGCRRLGQGLHLSPVSRGVAARMLLLWSR